MSKFVWEGDDLEINIDEDVTTTANTMGVVVPLGADPLRNVFPKKTKRKKRKKKLAVLAAKLESIT